MNNKLKDRGAESAANMNEDALFDSALNGSDQLLRTSLREDERRRRVRRILFFSLLIGGLTMGSVLLAFVAGWLTLATPPPAEASGDTSPARKVALSEDARIERAEELSKQGWALWQKQNFSDAAKKFEAAVELDSDAANAWNGLGWARFNSGDAKAAGVAFETCLALDPGNPAALNGLGQLYLSQRDYKNAEKFLTEAAPKAPAAWFGLARLYMLTGKFDEAQNWIKKALETQPDDPDLKKLLAAAQSRELPNDLRRQIEPAAKTENGPAATLAAEGWRQFTQGKARSAERSFRRALAKDPDNLPALNGLGFVLVNSGKTAEAKKCFEKYLKKEPGAPGPMNGLARCLKDEGQVDKAIDVWEKSYEKYPGPNAAAAGLAATYSERKQYGKAVKFYEELVKAQPNNAEFKNGLEEARKGAQKK
jgi:Flp pilus assembly protein TadD